LKKLLTVLPAIFLCGVLFAEDYKWNLIEALTGNEFQTIESIVSQNKNTLSDAEKRLIMNFAINFSYGENAVRVLDILEKHNIRPSGYDLYMAIKRNQPDVLIQSILNRGVQPNGEILLLTMEKQRLNLAALFIQMGADVNYSYPLTSSYADGMTPLLYAAGWNNFELVKMLLEKGAAVNAKDKNGRTALSIARTNENNQISDLLLEHGAVESVNVSQPAQDNRTLQAGVYRVYGGDNSIVFSGEADAGRISYVKDGIPRTGTYRIESNFLTLTMEGRTFIYNIISNTSFSGNGEIWYRVVN
jgi:hypothetical protein